MIKPPSLQKKYSAFYSGDPAILPLPDDATKEQRAERERLMKLAFDSGNWDEITAKGETITKFDLRPLTSEQYGELESMIQRGRPGFDVAALAFRYALLGAAPLPDGVQVKFVEHPKYGPIATTSFLDEAGCGGEFGALIIDELGTLAFERAKATSPKR